MKSLITILLSTMFLYSNTFYYEFGKKVELTQLKTSKSNDSILEYQTNDGKKVKFKNEIIMKCKKNENCEEVFSSMNISNYTKISSSFFHIVVQANQDIFILCQQLHENEKIEFAHPNYIKTRKMR